ncbi:MAG TPA: ABC transporter ATP-binding protein, partial [Firmicutes bacterium]|nr:ABC transporter ATP-binding protein [Bacillota bacterium]
MILCADSVEGTYGGTVIFSNLSISLRPGIVTGIIGPNGSGKSTLIRTLSRVLKPRVGTVLLDGKDIYRMPGNRVARSVAVVPQNGTPAFSYTVMEMVMMGRAPHLGRLEFEGPGDIEI